MATIPDHLRDLLDRPILATLATVMPDGQPQVHPVWVDYDGTYVRVNTVEGRRKHLNMEQHPKVTVLVTDPDNPFRWMEIRGTVSRITSEGGAEHIDKLARDYTGADRYAHHVPGDVRIICYIEPTRVVASG